MKNIKSEIFFDTIIVAAHEWGIKDVLMEKNMWFIKRIDNKNIKKIKQIAFYETSPIFAINYYAKVKNIIYNKELEHYDIFFIGKPIKIKSLSLEKNKRHLCPQGTKYTTIKRILNARKYSDLVDKK